MTVDPLALSAEVDRATGRLLDTVAGVDDAALAAPSRLPGWTRGHVLAHLARNADSYVNLLTWARTGVETPQYPSRRHRDADIEAAAGRPLAEHLADLRQACDRFSAAVNDMPANAWSAPIRYASGTAKPAAHVVWSRLREVEVHHVDLDAGYRTADWPDAFTLHLLHELAADLVGADTGFVVHCTDLPFTARIGAGGRVTVAGTARDMAAWLTGRDDGAGLTVDPIGPPPAIPTWK